MAWVRVGMGPARGSASGLRVGPGGGVPWGLGRVIEASADVSESDRLKIEA